MAANTMVIANEWPQNTVDLCKNCCVKSPKVPQNYVNSTKKGPQSKPNRLPNPLKLEETPPKLDKNLSKIVNTPPHNTWWRSGGGGRTRMISVVPIDRKRTGKNRSRLDE